jgi:hypothetical protein
MSNGMLEILGKRLIRVMGDFERVVRVGMPNGKPERVKSCGWRQTQFVWNVAR